MNPPGVLTILGASARAAAQSARRAGWKVCAGDFFADVDTEAVAAVTRVVDYPQELLNVAQGSPPGPWMYTGGLENHPDLVDAIAKLKPLWGNAGDVLRRVRDPFAVHACLTRHGLPAPRVALEAPAASSVERWLEKPLRSCGGTHIRRFSSGATKIAAKLPAGDTYFQEFIAGVPAAAIFVALPGGVALWGLTRQLIGRPWTAAHPFQYAGSIGPLTVGEQLGQQLRRLGEALAGEFGLRGIIGADGILADDGFWTVEVNPRYTASVELLERATGICAVNLHAQAFRQDARPLRVALAPPADSSGKLIYFTRRSVRVGRRFCEQMRLWNANCEFPLVADIPHEGELIAARHPVATVFAQTRDEEQVESQLRARADELDALLDCAAVR